MKLDMPAFGVNEIDPCYVLCLSVQWFRLQVSSVCFVTPKPHTCNTFLANLMFKLCNKMLCIGHCRGYKVWVQLKMTQQLVSSLFSVHSPMKWFLWTPNSFLSCATVSSGHLTVWPMTLRSSKSCWSLPPTPVWSPKKWISLKPRFSTCWRQNRLSHPVGNTSREIWPPMEKVRPMSGNCLMRARRRFSRMWCFLSYSSNWSRSAWKNIDAHICFTGDTT